MDIQRNFNYFKLIDCILLFAGSKIQTSITTRIINIIVITIIVLSSAYRIFIISPQLDFKSEWFVMRSYHFEYVFIAINMALLYVKRSLIKSLIHKINS